MLPLRSIYDLKAGIERGFFEPTPASIKGEAAGCPFCSARKFPCEISGKRMHLSGIRAGLVEGEIGDTYTPSEHEGLMASVSNLYAPHWLMPLPIRYNFIIDEIVVWICNRSFRGDGFYFNREDISAIVGVLWGKMIPAIPSEMSSFMIAHGMPSCFSNDFENLFGFGLNTLRMNCGKKARKILHQPDVVENAFFDAHRYNR